jgi:cell volume regulation protein A
MDVAADPSILLAAALVLAGALLSKTSTRFGVPSLLLFLVLGMVAGSEGLLGIEFDDFELASQFGTIALALILFSGGFSTTWAHVRPVLAPAVLLASVGVVISAVVLGALASWLLGFDRNHGLLLGAIIASTDAAAVFSILRSRGMGLKGNLRPFLELESGSNDPAAVFLTVGVIGIISGDGSGFVGLLGSFVVQMSVGVVAGYLLGRAAVWLINVVRLDYDGLYPVTTIAVVLILFEVTTYVGGSGFLAAYVAGLTFANSDLLHKRSLAQFHDAVAWLMQIAMFVLLGLLVFPSELGPVVWEGLAVAALLMLVARPVATVVCTLPFRMPWRHVGIVSWVGLRGATAVIVATFPVVEGIEGAHRIFNIIFFVVLTSVLIQGSTIPYVARLLKVAAPATSVTDRWIEASLPGDSGHDLHEIQVPVGSPAAGEAILDLHFPTGALVVLIQRGDEVVVPQGRTELEAGDRVLVMAGADTLPEVRRILGVT